MLDRRSFLKTGLAALPLGSLSEIPVPLRAEPAAAAVESVAKSDGALLADDAGRPWQRTVRRVGQLNMTEHDPVSMNIEEWADYWQSLKLDVIFISVTGILAFYPTQVPFHRRGKYLGDRDFFGECLAAAKKRGMRVVARMSPDLNWPDALKAHPEWAQRDAAGNVRYSPEDPRLFRTCMFSTYMTDYMPAVMREVNSRYDVDALYTNAWPPGGLPECYCENCRNLPPSGTPAYWDRFNERVLFLWKMYDAIAKEKKPTSFYFGNLGGTVRGTPNLQELGEICEWFHADNQGRNREDDPVWGCSIQGRVCSAVLDGKLAVNCTGAYATGPVRWRNASKSAAEVTMWLNQSLASGMVVDYHWVGAEDGLGEDRRWQKTGRDYYQWLSRHERHFANKNAIANIGVVIGQRTQLFYKAPAGTQMHDCANGIYYALLEGRFAWDYVHEDRLQLDRIQKYRALILPNIALLSDAQCAQLGQYVQAGGSLFATFETSMYDERNVRRSNFGLAEVFGIRSTGPVIGTNGNAYYSRIERQHPILDGFQDTNWLPGSQNRVPIDVVSDPILTVVPGFSAYPPELAYPRQSKTTEPSIVLREQGHSRLAYFSGDIEQTMWRSGDPDLSQLLQNTIRWVSGDKQPFTVMGEGLIETIAWETQSGYALHLLNYTNPNTHRGWLRKFYPIGEQKIRMELPSGAKVTQVELLRAERNIPFRLVGQGVEFVVPKINDYEVAAIYSV